jgi:hypothetical protein
VVEPCRELTIGSDPRSWAGAGSGERSAGAELVEKGWRRAGGVKVSPRSHGAVRAGASHSGPRAPAPAPGKKDAELPQKLGRLQPFLAVVPQECTGQLAFFGPT